MNDEDPTETSIFQVPLGYEPLAYFGRQRCEAVAFYKDQGGREKCMLLVRIGRGYLSIWICDNGAWPMP